jgi:hypothetical protein
MSGLNWIGDWTWDGGQTRMPSIRQFPTRNKKIDAKDSPNISILLVNFIIFISDHQTSYLISSHLDLLFFDRDMLTIKVAEFLDESTTKITNTQHMNREK